MKIFSSKQMHEADAYTIKNEPIESIDLMERASKTVFDFITLNFPDQNNFAIFCGKGNNGGDGLAIARMLANNGKNVSVYIVNYTDSASDDFMTNYERLLELENCNIIELSEFHIINIVSNTIIIDAIFGSGLNRPITDFTAEYINYLNSLPNKRIAIDIPSGLFADNPIEKAAVVFKADETITFQAPKLQFFFAENEQYVGKLTITDINLQSPFCESETAIEFVTKDDITLKKRTNFSHKGTFGHALLVSGSYGKIGASVLASKACLRTGCGLLTTHSPKCGYEILQIAIPEAMVDIDNNAEYISSIPDEEKYSAIGVGPGIGTNECTTEALINFIKNNTKPLILDADALNILSEHQDVWKFVKSNTIITPHPGEFDRLTCKHTTCYDRFNTQIKFAKEHNCIVILKGHYTSIATPDGKIFFNSTGNAGMATAGSGDVLTGIILSLLAQKYEPIEAAKIGVFIHGLAGDIANNGDNSPIIANDIILNINSAYKNILHYSK
ncbi:MAG: NAD(P)H-hydrate dehydratase [Bacteroidales bacterium]|nr:NAD(P)H-hydrate dehydratase [Bacteroidales bacterium]